MESQKFENLITDSAEALEHRQSTLAKKLEARAIIAAQVEAMKQAGEAYELSKEEIRMLQSFRSFKATCKPGELFKWQTRPVEGVTIHTDTGLIQDPQEVR